MRTLLTFFRLEQSKIVRNLWRIRSCIFNFFDFSEKSLKIVNYTREEQRKMRYGLFLDLP